MVGELSAAFAEFDIDVGEEHDVNAPGDAIVDPESAAVPVTIKRWALVDEQMARRLSTQWVRPVPDADTALVIVADRVTESARRVLESHGLSYLDLRGHLHFRTPRLTVVANVAPLIEVERVSSRLAGVAGLEVACRILLEPSQPPAVRELARQLNRSPGTVSEILRGLREDRLLSSSNELIGTKLFWAVADRWGRATRPHYLVSVPQPGDLKHVTGPLALGLHDSEGPGWALTDDVAAAFYDAPVAVSFARPSFLVPNLATVRRAVSVLGAAEVGSQAQCVVRAAPVSFACEQRQHSDGYDDVWLLARPLFVALDLARDAGRGREILHGWIPEDPWQRVW